MKKKGLIISTIVMVVVLIASLTTATYAWFSASSSAAVNAIEMNVGAASNVAIGVAKAANPGSVQTNYMYGNVEYNSSNGYWQNGTTGLGTSINTGLTLDVTAGVGTGTAGGYKYTAVSQSDLANPSSGVASIVLDGNTYVWNTASGAPARTTYFTFDSSTNTYTQVGASDAYSSSTTYYTQSTLEGNKYAMDPSYNYTSGHSFLKAIGDTFDTLQEPELARINEKITTGATANNGTDVVDLQMAIKPVKTGIFGTYCVIKVTPTNDLAVGMISALWADITVGSKTVTGVDLFDLVNSGVHFADTITTNNDGSYIFYFMIDAVSGSEMTANSSTVTPFSIRLFISGYDEDCVKDATGTSATIELNFYGVTKDSSSNYVYEGLDENSVAVSQDTVSFEHA